MIRFWPNLLLWKKGKKKQIDDPQTLGLKAGGFDKKTVNAEFWDTLAGLFICLH